jgi:hypothetical protein
MTKRISYDKWSKYNSHARRVQSLHTPHFQAARQEIVTKAKNLIEEHFYALGLEISSCEEHHNEDMFEINVKLVKNSKVTLTFFQEYHIYKWPYKTIIPKEKHPMDENRWFADLSVSSDLSRHLVENTDFKTALGHI